MAKKKSIDELLKEVFEEKHKEMDCNGDWGNCDKKPEGLEDLFKILDTAAKAAKLAKEYKADTKHPKLVVKIYSDRASVEYGSDKLEHKSLAAKTAITSILSTINDKDLREGIIAFACKETDTFGD